MIRNFLKHGGGVILLVLLLVISSCSDLHFNLPPGLKGDDGSSVYEIWKEEVLKGTVKWPKDQVSVADFLIYIKGEKGEKGADGKSAYQLWKEMIAKGNVDNPRDPGTKWPTDRDSEADFWDFITGRNGHTPYVGSNDNWWIDGKDTGVPARGKDGKDGKDGKSAYEIWKELVLEGVLEWDKDRVELIHFYQYLKGRDGKDGKDGIDGITPHIGENGNWFFGDKDTGVPARGKDGKDGVAGITPHIGDNDNWFIGTHDTGVPARGKDGKDGKDGVSPHIGDNGNWFIGTHDTGVPARGDKGDTGAAGKSAYELWVEEVAKGTIMTPEGVVWPAHENTIADFWRYLKGAKGDKGDDGKDGMSAYEFWKEQVLKNLVDDPRHPGQKWPTTEVTEADFYKFLTGKDGANGANGNDGADGKDGKSAYELWKEALAERCGTPTALIDYKTGQPWECTKNTYNDFLDFIRGKDGKDGKDGADGMPGEPGKPGQEVTVLLGAPNVIAQYSQQPHSEYVRTSDGGVKFLVYDKQGQLAPAGSRVKGLPGMPENKEYTTESDGSFIIPKEDLPWIQDVKSRWGKVKEVTINGEKLPSAQNTYVPNRVELKLEVVESTPATRLFLDNCHNLNFRILRKTSPDSPWQDLPDYLPNVTDIEYQAFRTNGEDPNQITGDPLPLAKGSDGNVKTAEKRTQSIFAMAVRRYVIQNAREYMNDCKVYWDGQDNYFTVKQKTQYYGLTPLWNGVCKMAPYQVSPYIKCLTLKTKKPNIDNTLFFFDSATAKFDFAHIQFDKFFKQDLKVMPLASPGRVLVYPEPMPENEAKAVKPIFANFSLTVGVSKQEAKSDRNPSGADHPEFTLETVYLNSRIIVASLGGLRHMFTASLDMGQLVEDPIAQNTYKILNVRPAMPTATVTYNP